MRWRRRSALVAALACCLSSSSCRTQDSGSGAAASQPSVTRGDPLMARHALEQGRALLQEGRSESAVHVLRRGAQLAPQDAALQRRELSDPRSPGS